jgi:DnaJ-class molecular chaperone
MTLDLYSILEVERGADASEIRRQYLKLSRQWHPDKSPPEKQEEATKKFQEISVANEILSDESKRSYYDQTGQIPGQDGGGPGGPSGPGGMPFGMGMPFGFNMNDLFGMFGGSGPGGRQPQRGRRSGKAPPRKTQIPLTLKDFYFGRTLHMNLERQRFCNDCKGEGATNMKSCAECRGSGSVTKIAQMGPMIMHQQGPCISCSGSGKTKGDSCKPCSGSKFIKQSKTLELQVKKGMKPGDVVSFVGESSHIEDFTDAGDVLVELIGADEDHGWERHGDILKHRIHLHLGEAICGKVVRLDGHPAHENGLYIQIPCGVQNRQEILVEGLGMPRAIGDGYGDAVLMLTVMASKEERDILENSKEMLQSLFKDSIDSATPSGQVFEAKPLAY